MQDIDRQLAKGHGKPTLRQFLQNHFFSIQIYKSAAAQSICVIKSVYLEIKSHAAYLHYDSQSVFFLRFLMLQFISYFLKNYLLIIF